MSGFVLVAGNKALPPVSIHTLHTTSGTYFGVNNAVAFRDNDPSSDLPNLLFYKPVYTFQPTFTAKSEA